MNEIHDYTPITIAQLAAQPTATLAYKLVNDPSAGNKVMHLRTAGETFVYGLASYTLPLMTAGTGNEDIAKYIMIAYRQPTAATACLSPRFTTTEGGTDDDGPARIA